MILNNKPHWWIRSGRFLLIYPWWPCCTGPLWLSPKYNLAFEDSQNQDGRKCALRERNQCCSTLKTRTIQYSTQKPIIVINRSFTHKRVDFLFRKMLLFLIQIHRVYFPLYDCHFCHLGCMKTRSAICSNRIVGNNSIPDIGIRKSNLSWRRKHITTFCSLISEGIEKVKEERPWSESSISFSTSYSVTLLLEKNPMLWLRNDRQKDWAFKIAIVEQRTFPWYGVLDCKQSIRDSST